MKKLIALLALLALACPVCLAESAGTSETEIAASETQAVEIPTSEALAAQPEADGSEAPVTYDVIYSSDNPIPGIAATIRPSVVEVVCSVENWDAVTREASVTPAASGSGCFIKERQGGGGYILTNYHVVQDCDDFKLRWLDGTEMEAEVLGYDDGTDIAVLAFTDAAPSDARPIPLGDSDKLVIGELAIVIGNPGDGSDVLYSTVTAGIISGLERSANANNFSRSVSVIQTDAAINVGNSGGALLNARGELVGIPTLKFMYTYDTVFEGLGFCIPINAVSAFVDQIIDTGVVVRPRMGMTVAAVDGPDEPMKKFPPAGIQVYEVEKGGPAEQAGIAEGDIITYANGNRVYTFLDLTVELDKCKAGDTIDLKICRYYDEKGELTGKYEELEFTVTLAMLD